MDSIFLADSNRSVVGVGSWVGNRTGAMFFGTVALGDFISSTPQIRAGTPVSVPVFTEVWPRPRKTT